VHYIKPTVDLPLGSKEIRKIGVRNNYSGEWRKKFSIKAPAVILTLCWGFSTPFYIGCIIRRVIAIFTRHLYLFAAAAANAQYGPL